MVVEIQPVESDGQHWIDVSIGDLQANRHGPFFDADEAGSMVRRLLQISRTLTSSSEWR